MVKKVKNGEYSSHKKPRGSEEDVSGNLALIKNLHEKYTCPRCKTLEFLGFEEGDESTLVCSKCGFKKPVEEK